MGKIEGYGKILQAYGTIKKLETYPGFSLSKLCDDIGWNYNEITGFMGFCDKVVNQTVDIGALSSYQKQYKLMAKELLRKLEYV